MNENEKEEDIPVIGSVSQPSDCIQPLNVAPDRKRRKVSTVENSFDNCSALTHVVCQAAQVTVCSREAYLCSNRWQT